MNDELCLGKTGVHHSRFLGLNWPMFVKLWKQPLRLIVLLAGLWLVLDLVAKLNAELSWFGEVGYIGVFWRRLIVQGIVLFTTISLSGFFLLGNLAIAHRLKYPQPIFTPNEPEIEFRLFAQPWKLPEDSPIPVSGFRLRWLLPLVVGLAFVLGVMLLQYGRNLADDWYASTGLLPLVSPRFQPESFWQILGQRESPQWQLGFLAGFVVFLIAVPQILWGIAIAFSLGLGAIFSDQWAKILLFFHPISFSNADPIFQRNISFYIFSLPVWELLEFWLIGCSVCAAISVSLVYLLSGNSISQGRFPGFSVPQQRHLYRLGAAVMFSLAVSYWLSRYRLLYSVRGVAYGASYTDEHIQLWSYTVLSILAAAIALFWLLHSFLWLKNPSVSQGDSAQNSSKTFKRKMLSWGLLLFGLYLLGWALPTIVQRLIVQPNELARERPYIQRSIAFTREAFDLARMEVRTFQPEDRLTYNDLQNNNLTVKNIRLWDTRPLLETNRQLQQIRLYYKFPNADIDRYPLITDTPASERGVRPSFPGNRENEAEIPVDKLGTEQENPPLSTGAFANNTEKQQVILAGRELDYSAVPSQAQTWVNQHLIYTHGYGFTLSPVNTVAAGGLPDYFVKDIGVGEATLRTSSERIRTSIPIGHPRIYYGEITDTYVMTPTKVKELDYPSGEDNVYNTYDGLGGVSIGSWWRRVLFAKYLNDWQMLLTRNFTQETKVLFRRNINERVREIAPFLRYDNDPYLVVANTNPETFSPTGAIPPEIDDTYLYWMIDAYTTSDRYPYSDPGDGKINYIRNSVKVVIDAYNGSVNFYVVNPEDPIISSWRAIFPHLFKPLSEMPVTLRTHIRYPIDLFEIQSKHLLTYHMTDPQVFYNRDDQWRVPNEIYGDESRPVAPYYLIMKLPIAESEEFILLLPFTPTSRTNLIGWLAGRLDSNYNNTLLLYQFPKQLLVYGPEQIEARINQDPIISQQISLWNRRGSRAIQGNLLVIPIEQSLLYVEPIYLEAEQNSLPTLARVVVAYENNIAMAQSLEQALQAIFQPNETTAPVILSPGDSSAPLNQPILSPQENP